ncbi:hypothetical protein GCM10009605_59050 [Nocardiopsis composta]
MKESRTPAENRRSPDGVASDGAAEEAPLSPLLAAVLLGAFLPWPGWAAITGFIWGILFFVYLGVSPAVSGPLLLAAIAAGGGWALRRVPRAIGVRNPAPVSAVGAVVFLLPVLSLLAGADISGMAGPCALASAAGAVGCGLAEWSGAGRR